jgi:hypothetical protein
LFIPLIISLLFSLRQPIFLSRNLMAAPGYFLLVAGDRQFRSPKAVLALLLHSGGDQHRLTWIYTWYEQKEDWRSVALYGTEAQGKEGGLVVFLPGYAEIPSLLFQTV